MTDRRIVNWAAAWLGMVAATACAGGAPGPGEASATGPRAANPAAAPPATVSAPAAVQPATEPQDIPDCDIAGLRAELLKRVNDLRASGAQCGSEGGFGAAPPLLWNDRLAQAAARHSRDMARRNYLEHNGRDGSTPAARVEATGYLWSLVAENIAGGQPTAARVMESWLRSPGHCANLLRPGLQHVGAACMKANGTRYETYWTLVLAAPQQHQ